MSFQTLQRKAEFRFFVPGDRRHAQRSVLVGIENGATEHQADRDVAIRQAIEVLGCRDAEIEGTGHLQVNGCERR